MLPLCDDTEGYSRERQQRPQISSPCYSETWLPPPQLHLRRLPSCCSNATLLDSLARSSLALPLVSKDCYRIGEVILGCCSWRLTSTYISPPESCNDDSM